MRAAKISAGGGALFRACEGAGCRKVEGRDVERLNACAKCKAAVYCSRACQASAWKTHKEACGSAECGGQMLPSQVAIRERVSPCRWRVLENLEGQEIFAMPRSAPGAVLVVHHDIVSVTLAVQISGRACPLLRSRFWANDSNAFRIIAEGLPSIFFRAAHES